MNYYGGGIQKVYEVIGYSYRDNFIRKNAKLKLSKLEIWDELIEFIGHEIKIQEQINLVDMSSRNDKERYKSSEKEFKKYNSSYTASVKTIECVLCEKNDHSVTTDHFGRQVVQYFSCKMFVDMTPKERF